MTFECARHGHVTENLHAQSKTQQKDREREGERASERERDAKLLRRNENLRNVCNGNAFRGGSPSLHPQPTQVNRTVPNRTENEAKT